MKKLSRFITGNIDTNSKYISIDSIYTDCLDTPDEVATSGVPLKQNTNFLLIAISAVQLLTDAGAVSSPSDLLLQADAAELLLPSSQFNQFFG